MASNILETPRKISVVVSGIDVAGKSTVLTIMAQKLAELGYEVKMPNHLLGLGINEDVLHRGTSEETEVSFVEQGREWCTCQDAGTCLGCLIEATIKREFGNQGRAFLQRHLNRGVA